jgi:hypothetical protein
MVCRDTPKVSASSATGAVLKALRRINTPEFWADAALWQGVAAALPSYLLSKFQPLMPEPVQRELVGATLLDVAGAQRFLTPARIDALR